VRSKVHRIRFIPHISPHRHEFVSGTLRVAYHQPDSYSRAVANAKAFIFSFLALVAISNLQSNALLGHDGEGWALEAHRLVREVVESPPSLDELQSIVILVKP
jgi:hypothetical protein